MYVVSLLLPHPLDEVVVQQQHTHRVLSLVTVQAADELLQQSSGFFDNPSCTVTMESQLPMKETTQQVCLRQPGSSVPGRWIWPDIRLSSRRYPT